MVNLSSQLISATRSGLKKLCLNLQLLVFIITITTGNISITGCSDANLEYTEDTTYSLSDLTGTWHLRSLGIKSADPSDDDWSDTGTFIIQSDGSFAGTMFDSAQPPNTWNETGTAAISTDGAVTFRFPDTSTWSSFVLSSGKDTMFGYYENINGFSLDVLSKKATSYSSADLTGTWYLRSLGIKSADPSDDDWSDTGTFIIQSDGSFTGTMFDSAQPPNTWNESGTAAISSDGAATFTFANTSTWSSFVLSSGKDAMFGYYEDVNGFSLDVLSKKATSYSSADLTGTWYLRSLGIKSADPSDDDWSDTGTFIIQSDGSFTGTMFDSAQPANTWNESGTAAISSDGAATFTFANTSTWSSFVLSSGKDTMFGYYENANGFSLDILSKR